MVNEDCCVCDGREVKVLVLVMINVGCSSCALVTAAVVVSFSFVFFESGLTDPVSVYCDWVVVCCLLNVPATC